MALRNILFTKNDEENSSDPQSDFYGEGAKGWSLEIQILSSTVKDSFDVSTFFFYNYFSCLVFHKKCDFCLKIYCIFLESAYTQDKNFTNILVFKIDGSAYTRVHKRYVILLESLNMKFSRC